MRGTSVKSKQVHISVEGHTQLIINKIKIVVG